MGRLVRWRQPTGHQYGKKRGKSLPLAAAVALGAQMFQDLQRAVPALPKPPQLKS